ncbi:hypothetical protein EBZ39_15175, partial [bacterium]|nr:hypothetical protein [bacterium]
LMENPDDAIAEKLARLENLPPELHSKVASAGNNENIVQELLSKRKDLNPDTFKLLAQNPKLASWLVKNPNLPPELHTNIASHGDHEANVELARFTKPELLKHLIDTNGVGSWVHEAAAQNKNITPELLKHLVEKNQAGSIVHLNAVMNQNIHPELLKHLIDVNKPGSRIHEYAAINPQITPDAFKHLIENNKSGSLVHLAAALNKNIIPETLKYLVERNEAGSEVHHRAAENPNLTLEAARYIASKNRPDSNIHRLAQEAIRRLSSGNVNKSESLDKNLAGLLTGAALNLMSSNPSATAQKPVAQARPSWSPEGLHQDMLPIAHLESNFGKNTQHAAHSKGEYHTAVGAVGLKPVTAHEEYKKSKAIQKAFPGLEEPSDFVQRMKSDNQFYNLLATSHFLRLKARHGSPERAAFAWRWGTGAAQNASDEQVSSDPYVQKYVQIANKLKAKQALALKSEQDVWGMPIEKAIDPKEFKSIVRASTPEGKNHVDHTLHLNEHPEEHRDWVSGYRNEILGSPKSYKKLKKAQDGITKKVILTQNTPAGDTEKFMVKPYHERVIKRTQGWQKFPIQGWAEMTNQALYHAGDIGHLHQKVHVSEHNMVVHLEKGFQPVQNKRAELESLQLSRHFSHKTQQDALKIGLMDFLTNNLDRHGGNLMVSDNNEDLKAIDHSRSFQYINNRSS